MGKTFNADWIEIYIELANVLKTFKNNRTELIEKIKNIYSNIDMPLPTLEMKGSDVIDIDPFTIFGLFNKSMKLKNRLKILEGFKNEFGLLKSLPQAFESIPVLNPLKSTFYAFQDRRGDKDINNLWAFFEIAIDYADNQENEALRQQFISLFNIVSKQLCVSWNLTMGLYWVRPYNYLNLDATNRSFLLDVNNTSSEFVVKIGKLNKFPSAESYLQIIDNCKQLLQQNNISYSTLPELSYCAWKMKKTEPQWKWEDYDSGITEEKWLELLNDKEFFDDDSIAVMKCFYSFEDGATCTELANKYGKNKNYYMNIALTIADRIRKKIDISMPSNTDEKEYLYPILFLAKKAEKSQDGVYIWKIREPLYSALTKYLMKNIEDSDNPIIASKKEKYTKKNFLDEVFMREENYDSLVSLLKRKKNIILQGAPGVGKTYAAKRLAYSIIKEKNEDQIAFIQFHQNYSYEDFMMGYKPNANGSFELKTGVFYDFCEIARLNKSKEYFFIIDEINRGNMSKIFGELLMSIEKEYRNEPITLAYDNKKFSVPDNLYIIGLMNTADRSLAMIDYALRRRFSFFEMKPQFLSGGFIAYQNTVQTEDNKFTQAIEQIIALNKEIEKDLGKGFEIGHSYFIADRGTVITKDWVKAVIDYDIIPMLQEYWFDNEEKLNGQIEKLSKIFND